MERLKELLKRVIENTKDSIIGEDAENTGMQNYLRGQLKAYQRVLEDIIPLTEDDDIEFQ